LSTVVASPTVYCTCLHGASRVASLDPSQGGDQSTTDLEPLATELIFQLVETDELNYELQCILLFYAHFYAFTSN